jgi:hypothetical protein
MSYIITNSVLMSLLVCNTSIGKIVHDIEKNKGDYSKFNEICENLKELESLANRLGSLARKTVISIGG